MTVWRTHEPGTTNRHDRAPARRHGILRAADRELLRPGAGFHEISEKAWHIPEEFLDNRYGSLIHGVGLCDEFPSIKHWPDFEHKGYDGTLREGMVLCVESYIGARNAREGVKLEEQVLITANGYEQLSRFPLDLV